jgi:hypothetical protein
VRPRLATTILAAVLLGALVTTAVADVRGPIVRLTACQTGDEERERLATFHGRMTTIPGAERMWMRFTLLERVGTGPELVVPTTQLRVWRKSRPGVRTFGYRQTVAGLENGTTYRALVRFRWYDSEGRLLRSARRHSPECRIAGDLPNLRVLDVRALPGDTPGTEVFSVDVTNDGKARADVARLDLFVDSGAPDGQDVGPLEPGETRTVRFTGPACRNRIRAVVDRENAIREMREDDNRLASRCPTAAGAPGFL